MTIEQLKKYCDICAEIDEIQQELDGGHYVRCKACRMKAAEYQFERRHADER